MKIKNFILSTFLSCIPAVSFGFAEDICYSKTGGLQNCFAYPCEIGDVSLTCQAKALKGLQENLDQSHGGRSTLHTDATYYLAQIIGFNADQAHVIASYNEATDLGIYAPHDINGQPLVGRTDLITKDISGLTRFNFRGFLLHYVIPYNPQQKPINGLHPNIHDADTEVTLANIRRWVYEDTPLCIAGITNLSPDGDYATGDGCFKPESHFKFATISGVVPIKLKPYTFELKLAEHLIKYDENNRKNTIFARQFDHYIGADADLARLGIYLHSVADRISHHQCGDTSYITGPDSDDNFAAHFNMITCSHGLHTLWHSWEVGIKQDKLPAQAQTLEPALNIMYDELLAYAKHIGIVTSKATNADYKKQHIHFLLKALETFEPDRRVSLITEQLNDLDLTPLPGH